MRDAAARSWPRLFLKRTPTRTGRHAGDMPGRGRAALLSDSGEREGDKEGRRGASVQTRIGGPTPQPPPCWPAGLDAAEDTGCAVGPRGPSSICKAAYRMGTRHRLAASARSKVGVTLLIYPQPLSERSVWGTSRDANVKLTTQTPL